MSIIKSFTQGATSSGMMTWYAAVLDCGHWHYSEGWNPFPAEVQVGTAIECKACASLKAEAEKLEALDLSGVAYARFSPRFAYPDQNIHGQYHIYRRDKSSPTGVSLLMSVTATKEIDAIIDRRRICTLSPTEGR